MLDHILLLCLLAMVAGAETITDIASFGRLKLHLLSDSDPTEDRTSVHDQLGDILATVDTEADERCFVACRRRTRSSGREWSPSKARPAPVRFEDLQAAEEHQGPIHIVSAFAARQRLVLGQVKVAEKSNEIVAIPKLLRLL